MSDVYHGIIIPAALNDAKIEFLKLSSQLTLRLVSFSESVQGVYSLRDIRGNNYAIGELSRISRQFSTVFEFAILYFYDSRTGFYIALLECGRQTKASKHHDGYAAFDPGSDLPDFEESFAVLKRLGLNDEIIEDAFHWSLLEAVVHNQPDWERAKERYPIGCPIEGRVVEHYKNSGIVIDLGDPVAQGFVNYSVYGELREIATDNFPNIGETLLLIVDKYSDEWRKTIFLLTTL